MLKEKLGPCPKCGGYAVVDRFAESPRRYEVSVRCMRCGLAMDYDCDILEDIPVRVTWSYYLDKNLSVFDVWKSYKEAQHETN